MLGGRATSLGMSMNGGSGSMCETLGVGVLTHHEEVFYEQLRVYLTRTRTAVLSAPLAWALLAYIQGYNVGYAPALVWVMLVVVPDAFGLFFACRFDFAPPRPEQYFFWRYRQHFLHALAGLGWGSSIFFFLQPGNVVGELVVYLFLIGVTANCVTALSPFRTAVAMFTVCSWLPPMVNMLIIGDLLHLQLLMGVVVLLGVENLYSWVANRQLLEGIEQAVSNRRLNEALLMARDELHRANRDLESKNNELLGMTRRLRDLAMHDDLTGSYNRRYLLSQIEDEAAVCARHGLSSSLLMIDIDHFKRVNDQFGHLCGDAVLRELAEIVQTALRESDVFARYGGEEFVAVLRMTGRDEALGLAERLRRMIASHIFQMFPEYRQVTISVGVADYQEGDRADTWLERADSALYQAKAGGRDCVAVYAQLCLPVGVDDSMSFANRRKSASESVATLKVVDTE